MTERPPLKPIRGAQDPTLAEDDTGEEIAIRRTADEPETAAEAERDERMREAVEAARLAAEERATAEILALEEDLEQERMRSAQALLDLQRKLDEAESRAESSKVPEGPEQKLDFALHHEISPREAELIEERNKAGQALREATARAEEAEAAAERAEQERLEAEERVRGEAERQLSETEERINQAVAEARRQAEEQIRRELADEVSIG